MQVKFPDGSVITGKSAVDVLYLFVKRVGVSEVRRVVEEHNLKFCKIPVISNRRDEKYGNRQKELGGGWLLMTHSNNPMKKEFIEKVSQYLKLGVEVDLE